MQGILGQYLIRTNTSFSFLRLCAHVPPSRRPPVLASGLRAGMPGFGHAFSTLPTRRWGLAFYPFRLRSKRRGMAWERPLPSEVPCCSATRSTLLVPRQTGHLRWLHVYVTAALCFWQASASLGPSRALRHLAPSHFARIAHRPMEPARCPSLPSCPLPAIRCSRCCACTQSTLAIRPCRVPLTFQGEAIVLEGSYQEVTAAVLGRKAGKVSSAPTCTCGLVCV